MRTWLDTSRFRLHPAVLHGQRMLTKLEKQFGTESNQWAGWLKAQGLNDRLEVDSYLKETCGLGSIQRRIFMEAAFAEKPENYREDAYLAMAPQYVENQYVGKKEPLRAVYAFCAQRILSLGEDVWLSPCKTYVPAYRKHVFAHIIPATQKRIDLGLALGAFPGNDRLKSTGGFKKGDRITHKLALSTSKDWDEDCQTWLRQAYECHV